MARASWLLAVLGPLLAACVGSGPIEPVRDVPGSPAQVSERLEAGFQHLGLGAPRVGSDGTLSFELSHARTSWARCRAMLVSGGDDRRQMVTAARRYGAVDVTLSPVSVGTRVAVRTRYTGVYRNTATGYTFETPCESTGAVEQGLLAAATGAQG